MYLDKTGKWFVDSVVPVIIEGKYGTYDPRHARRHVGSIYIKADGTFEEITEFENFRTITVVDLTASGDVTLTALTASKLVETDVSKVLISAPVASADLR